MTVNINLYEYKVVKTKPFSKNPPNTLLLQWLGGAKSPYPLDAEGAREGLQIAALRQRGAGNRVAEGREARSVKGPDLIPVSRASPQTAVRVTGRIARHLCNLGE